MISDGIVPSPPLRSLVRGALRAACPTLAADIDQDESTVALCVLLPGNSFTGCWKGSQEETASALHLQLVLWVPRGSRALSWILVLIHHVVWEGCSDGQEWTLGERSPGMTILISQETRSN